MVECYRAEEEGYRLNALANFLHQQGFPQHAIEKYRMIDETLERSEQRICPVCFLNDNKIYRLDLLSENDGKETHHCGVCNTTFTLAVKD
jgi:hypothetical protein